MSSTGSGVPSDVGEEERDHPLWSAATLTEGAGGAGGLGTNWSTVLMPEHAEFVNPRGVRFTSHSQEGIISE